MIYGSLKRPITTSENRLFLLPQKGHVILVFRGVNTLLVEQGGYYPPILVFRDSPPERGSTESTMTLGETSTATKPTTEVESHRWPCPKASEGRNKMLWNKMPVVQAPPQQSTRIISCRIFALVTSASTRGIPVGSSTLAALSCDGHHMD